MKADIHMHGAIGFQPYWLKVQGYQGKNLLEEIANSCFRKEIGICAITSHEDEIPRNSVHDRFNWLKDKYAKDLPGGYNFGSLGKNVAFIENEGEKRVYLINGQTVLTGSKEKSKDYLVVGTNEIPNHKTLEWTVKEVYGREDCFGGPEHGFCVKHGGLGEEEMERFWEYFDFGEGFNSQLVLPFGSHRRSLNKKAQEFFEYVGKPWIATSDAHRVESAGISYIEFDDNLIDDSDEEHFISSFKQVVKNGEFQPHCQYESLSSWLNWVGKFQWGIHLAKNKIR